MRLKFHVRCSLRTSINGIRIRHSKSPFDGMSLIYILHLLSRVPETLGRVVCAPLFSPITWQGTILIIVQRVIFRETRSFAHTVSVDRGQVRFLGTLTLNIWVCQSHLLCSLLFTFRTVVAKSSTIRPTFPPSERPSFRMSLSSFLCWM